MIVGISGKIGCGKTTLANMLVDALGPAWLRVALGDEVKKEAAEIFGFPLRMAHCPDGKKTMVPLRHFNGSEGQMSVREILQYWGTDVRRAEDPDYWVRKLTENLPAGKKVIIDDIRFMSEVDFIRRHGGKLFRLNQYPGYEPPPGVCNHISETELDDYPHFDMSITPKLGGLHYLVDHIVDVVREAETAS